LLEEQPIFEFFENIDGLVVSNMSEFENAIVDDFVVNM